MSIFETSHERHGIFNNRIPNYLFNSFAVLTTTYHQRLCVGILLMTRKSVHDVVRVNSNKTRHGVLGPTVPYIFEWLVLKGMFDWQYFPSRLNYLNRSSCPQMPRCFQHHGIHFHCKKVRFPVDESIHKLQMDILGTHRRFFAKGQNPSIQRKARVPFTIYTIYYFTIYVMIKFATWDSFD